MSRSCTTTPRCIALALIASIGCGGDKVQAPDEAPPPAPAQPAPAPAPVEAPAPAPAQPVVAKPEPDGVVRLTANDTMRFSASRIEVPAGQKVKIELKNIGVMPKEAMGHNIAVLKAGADMNAFAMKAVAAKATDYMPADSMDQVIAHTKILGPAEAQTIELELPGPGTYPFLCTFPGHFALMKGELVAQ